MTTALQLRCLIRNDEALVEHLAAQLQGDDGVIDALPTPTGYCDDREPLLERLGDVLRRLQTRRAQLQTLSPTAEPTASKPHRSADSSHELQPSGGTLRPAVGETISHV